MTPLFDLVDHHRLARAHAEAHWQWTQFRVRDVALEAMLTIQYGDKAKGCAAIGDVPADRRVVDSRDELDPVRAHVIERLRGVLRR